MCGLASFGENLQNFSFTAVDPKGSEVLTGTPATISCVVTGLTKDLNGVAWQNANGDPITPGGGDGGYQIADGSYEPASNSQTTTLTVPGDLNEEDAVYSCVITCTEHGIADQKTAVNSNIFSKYILGVVDI